jgi:hypothetical protein
VKISALVPRDRHPSISGDSHLDPLAVRRSERQVETVLGFLAGMLRHAFSCRDARREAYLASSADLKDYEHRLKSWHEEEERDRRFREALWP